MSETDKLRQLQMIEVEILDEFVRICERHNLTYYLYVGTLLGGVRHKGFIPWDDDLDVAMPRKDFERFRIISKKEIAPRYFVQDDQSDPGFAGGMIRILKRGTKYISEYGAHYNLIEQGIWMDIYPIDNVSNPRSLRFFLQAIVNRQIINRMAFQRAFTNCKGRSPLRKVAYYASRIMPLQAWTRLRDWISRMDDNDTSELCSTFTTNYSWRKNLMPRAVFGEPVKVEFEGKQYNAPRDWDYVLRRIYGDYMQLPPLDERKTHEPIIWEM